MTTSDINNLIAYLKDNNPDKKTLADILQNVSKEELNTVYFTEHDRKNDQIIRSALSYAIESKNTNTIKALIEHGADPNQATFKDSKNYDLTYPLHDAAHYPEIAKMLLEHGADPNKTAEHSKTPLYYAIAASEPESVKILLDHGAKPNQPTVSDILPLHDAIMNTEIMAILLEKGADINARLDNGQSPLVYAAGHSHHAAALFLIENGADVNSKPDSGYTALHLAAYSGDTELAQALLEKGANVNAQSFNGRTPLHVAADRYYHDGVKEIFTALAKKTDLTLQDDTGKTALHRTCSDQNLAATRILIDNGAPLNQQDNKGDTPLHRILDAEYNKGMSGQNPYSPAVLKLMLKAGANPDIHNYNGQSFRTLSEKHPEIHKTLHEPPEKPRPAAPITLSEKQLAVLAKHYPDKLDEFKANPAAGKEQLDIYFQGLKNHPLSEKQQKVVDRNAPEEVKQAIRDGNNAAGHEWLREFFIELKTHPLTGEQRDFIETYGSKELIESVARGDNEAGRVFVRDTISEMSYPREPLNKIQMELIEHWATKDIRDKVFGGDHSAGKKFFYDISQATKQFSTDPSKPLNTAEKLFIETYGNRELPKASLDEQRHFLQSTTMVFKNEYQQIYNKPLTERETAVLNKLAPQEIKDAVANGDNLAGRKYLIDLANDKEKIPQKTTSQTTPEKPETTAEKSTHAPEKKKNVSLDR